MKILLFGTPGTGKTSIGRCLQETYNFKFFETKEFAYEHGYYWGYDWKRRSMILDTELFEDFLEAEILKKEQKMNICIAGPVIYINPQLIDFVVVLRCRPDILRKRLETRNYPPQKIEANVEAEIMDIVYLDTLEHYSKEKVISFDTTFISPQDAAKKLLKSIHTSL